MPSARAPAFVRSAWAEPALVVAEEPKGHTQVIVRRRRAVSLPNAGCTLVRGQDQLLVQ